MTAVRPIHLEAPEVHWSCPSCNTKMTTRLVEIHTPMHACAGLRGLMAPFIPAGQRGEHRIEVRQDYLGPDQIGTRDAEGREIMSVTTVRDEGQDCTIFAPCTTVRTKVR